MLELKLDNYTITCIKDPDYSQNSADTKFKYDFVYSEGAVNLSTVKYGIRVSSDDKQLKSAIVYGYGGATGLHDNAIAIAGPNLLICIGNSIVSLAIPSLALNWRKQCDNATCFEILPFQNDFVVHGELEITRIKETGEIVWQKGGSDIFVTAEGKDDFRIENGLIFAQSWDGRKYKFKEDGTES